MRGEAGNYAGATKGKSVTKHTIARQAARSRAAYALRQYRATGIRSWWREYHSAMLWDRRMEVEGLRAPPVRPRVAGKKGKIMKYTYTYETLTDAVSYGDLAETIARVEADHPGCVIHDEWQPDSADDLRERRLVWASEEDAQDDDGRRAIGQIVREA